MNPANTKMPILNKNIKIIRSREHKKASEKYLDVIFTYSDSNWEGSVPIEYRRTGVMATTNAEIIKHLNRVYEQMDPKNYGNWLKEEEKFWDSSKMGVTKPFFDAMKDTTWKCRNCELPENPNWARRFQEIKELGYTTATDTKMFCKKCSKKTTHVILLPLPRGHARGYERWTPKLRNRIIKTLEQYDVYECRTNKSLLPDHKFPEIRWDKDTKEENPADMSEAKIRSKFQLISNQRNQQKREVCRNCYQTGQRGFPYGIKFFYEGEPNWPSDVPKTGKDAEKGCIGCGWYDLAEWRKKLNEIISQN